MPFQVAAAPVTLPQRFDVSCSGTSREVFADGYAPPRQAAWMVRLSFDLDAGAYRWNGEGERPIAAAQPDRIVLRREGDATVGADAYLDLSSKRLTSSERDKFSRREASAPCELAPYSGPPPPAPAKPR